MSISGDFEIDKDFALYNCVVSIAKDVKITVKNKAMFQVLYSKLFCCGAMWQGINTEATESRIVIYKSEIEDALIVVDASKGGQISTNYSTLNRNEIGLYLESLPKLLSFNANTVSCTSPLNKGGITKYGIEAVYMPLFTIGSAATPKNTFIGLNTGIYSLSSKINVVNTSFKNMQGAGHGIDNLGVGVTLNVNNASNSDDGFSYCYRGINARATGNISVSQTTFSNNRNAGVHIEGNCVGGVTVKNCYFFQEEAGYRCIELQQNAPIATIIQNNDFDVFNKLTCVNVTEDYVTPNLDISNNKGGLTSKAIFNEVRAIKTNNIKIYSNNIDFSGAKGDGILLFNLKGSNHQVYSNVIRDVSPVIYNSFSTTDDGILGFSCNGVSYCGNSVETEDRGMSFGFNNMGTSLTKNHMGGLVTGLLLYGTGVAISPQIHRKNTWNYNYSPPIGVGATISGLLPTDPNYANYLKNSQFEVDFTKKTGSTSRTFVPPSINPTSGWFISGKDSGVDFLCGKKPPMKDAFSGNENVTALDEIIASGEFANDYPEGSLLAWEAAFYLGQKISEYPILSKEYPIFESFYSKMSNAQKTLHQTRVKINEANNLSEAQTKQLNILNLNIDNFKNTLAEIDNKIGLLQKEEKIEESNNLETQKISILNGLAQFSTSLDGLNKAIDLQRQEQLQKALDELSSTEMENTFETYYKELYQVSLSHIVSGKKDYNESEIEVITKIARECYLIGGPAVFWARTMLPCNEDVDVHIKENCIDKSPILTKTSKQDFTGSKTYYSNGSLYVNDVEKESKVVATNLLGQIIDFKETVDDNQNLIFDVNNWQNGTYIISIANSKGIIFNQKINIIK